MFGKCKCNCVMNIVFSEIKQQSNISKLFNIIMELKSDIALLEYKLTGDNKALDKLYFKQETMEDFL